MVSKVRLPKTDGYWWNVIVGGFLAAMILMLTGNLLLTNRVVSYFLCLYYFICISVVTFYQWNDDNLSTIKTGLSEKENFDVVAKALHKLKWTYEKRAKRVELCLNKYVLKFLNPTIIPQDNCIHYNFKYSSTSRTGRLPFFFGISTYVKWKFKKTIEETVLHVQQPFSNIKA